MEATSEGLAYATPMDAWMPELMYRSAQLYAALDKPQVAKAVFKEIQLFFFRNPIGLKKLIFNRSHFTLSYEIIK